MRMHMWPRHRNVCWLSVGKLHGAKTCGEHSFRNLRCVLRNDEVERRSGYGGDQAPPNGNMKVSPAPTEGPLAKVESGPSEKKRSMIFTHPQRACILRVMQLRRLHIPSLLNAVFTMALMTTACLPNVAGPELAPPTAPGVLPNAGGAIRLPTEPDLFGWDPGSRANLYRLHRDGVVVVRYEARQDGAHLELLSNCIGSVGAYRFTPYAETKTKIAHNANELSAALPIGAASLAGKLSGNRALRADYMLLGIASLPAGMPYDRKNLRGPDCARATHVVTSIHLGGFAMVAGDARKLEAAASVFSARAGVSTSGDIEEVDRAGNADECDKAQKAGAQTQLCSVPLRVGLLSLDASASAPPYPMPEQRASSGYSQPEHSAPPAQSAPSAPSAPMKQDAPTAPQSSASALLPEWRIQAMLIGEADEQQKYFLNMRAPSEAPQMKADGSFVVAEKLAEGYLVEWPINIAVGGCYTVLASARKIKSLHIALVMPSVGPAIPATILAQSTSPGEQASLGANGNCWKNPFPLPFVGKVVITAEKGTDVMVARVYVK
jgi:hypothetical protein